jgi:hypothetical protein
VSGATKPTTLREIQRAGRGGIGKNITEFPFRCWKVGAECSMMTPDVADPG